MAHRFIDYVDQIRNGATDEEKLQAATAIYLRLLRNQCAGGGFDMDFELTYDSANNQSAFGDKVKNLRDVIAGLTP